MPPPVHVEEWRAHPALIATINTMLRALHPSVLSRRLEWRHKSLVFSSVLSRIAGHGTSRAQPYKCHSCSCVQPPNLSVQTRPVTTVTRPVTRLARVLANQYVCRQGQRRPFSVRVRFAPSPTGSLHIGGLRTALFNYLFAKRMGGAFVLRIEDTDKTREVAGSVDDIMSALEWCGIQPDEGPGSEYTGADGDRGPYRQSDRLHLYREYCQRLVDSRAAYPCFCSKERLAALKDSWKSGRESGYDGKCSHIDPTEAQRRVDAGETHTIRMKIPRTLEGDGCSFLSALSESKSKPVIRFRDELRGEIMVGVDRIDDQVIMKSDGFPTYV